MPTPDDVRATASARPGQTERGLSSVRTPNTGDGAPSGMRTGSVPGFVGRRGFVAEQVFRDAVVATARRELSAWANGSMRDDSPQGIAHINRYMRDTGLHITMGPNGPTQAWSALFVSFCVNAASVQVGITSPLRLNIAHFRYAADAYAARAHQRGHYWAYRVGERPLANGDIVVKWRENPFGYDDLANAQAGFSSHGDIVIDSTNGSVVGGNLRIAANNPDMGHSVRQNAYPMLRDRRIDTQGHSYHAQDVVAVLSIEPDQNVTQFVPARSV